VTAYLDSSAVVKLYVPERGHEAVRSLDGVTLSSAVTRVEVASALWRKERLGELDAMDAVTLLAAFDADQADPARRLTTVVVDQRVLDEATEVVARHALRAYDAVQLATAIVVRRTLGRLEEFAAFDRGLRRAAAAERFTLVPERLDAR
jgi:predicted nucleic acid-binding protein